MSRIVALMIPFREMHPSPFLFRVPKEKRKENEEKERKDIQLWPSSYSMSYSDLPPSGTPQLPSAVFLLMMSSYYQPSDVGGAMLCRERGKE